MRRVAISWVLPLLLATVVGSLDAGDTVPGAVGYTLEPATSGAPVAPEILHDGEHVKIALVTIAPGAEMPEHSAPVPVTVQTISGAGSMTVSGKPVELVAGRIYYMDANAPHALNAEPGAPLVVLVHYLRGGHRSDPGHDSGHDH